MSSIPILPNASASIQPDSAAITAVLERLRAESEAAPSNLQRALWHHELAVLQLLAGDDAMAAQDELAAINEEPEFGEPLEQLIDLVERRESYRNLARLLERLVDLAQTAEERTRALMRRAALLADHESDLPGAVDLLERAIEASPDEPACYLALEFAAAKMGDDGLRQRALAARAALADPPVWRALLLLDLARLQFDTGDADAAYQSIEQALAAPTQALFAAQVTLETLARKDDRIDLVARALDAQARLIVTALDDPDAGDAAGVPRWQRTPAHAGDAWLRAAEALRSRGSSDAAAALLDEALERSPEDLALIHARLRLADLNGDTNRAAALARAELGTGVRGPVAAAAWLRLAEAAAAEGDAGAALSAVERALTEDPAGLPARALKLDLLSGGHDPTALASSLEGLAEQLPNDDAKARQYLLAAEVWARLGNDAAGARAALSQAALYGSAPRIVARVGRMLATLIADQAWYEEATRRLLATSNDSKVQSELWFELGRAKLLRGDRTGADAAFASLSELPEGSWLGRTLLAYVAGLTATETSSASSSALKALDQLAQNENDPLWARALSSALALRSSVHGDRAAAAAQLEKLHQAEPSDPVAAVALAAHLKAAQNFRRAGEVLLACGSVGEDAALQRSFGLEAGMLFWRAGERALAIDCFSAHAEGDGAASVLLSWALRAAAPDDLEARRRALEAASGGRDHDAANLERFALEAGKTGDPHEAYRALEEIGNFAHPDLAAAALLARALWQRPDDDSSRVAALEQLLQYGPQPAALARAALYQYQLEQPDPDREAIENAAAVWAASEPRSVAAALEWTAAAMASGNATQEVHARRALAERVGGELGVLTEVSAALVSTLNGEPSPLLRGEHPAARLTNLELALPGSNPKRRAIALLGLGDTLGEDSIPLANALAGWNQLAAGDAASALQLFRAVVDESPYEVTAWEGLRAAAELARDQETLAEACAALGDAVSDPRRGAEYWERAATLLLDHLKDPERGELALSRAVERDVARFSSFDRLFRLVRARKDGPRLLQLISARLEVTDDGDELAKLYWERARVLRAAGDRAGALRALEDVTMLEPDHVGALALAGEIHLSSGDFAAAAESLARLAALQEAPAKQRLMSGVAAVDIYENKLNDYPHALEVLVLLYGSGLSTLPVRERLARLAARTGAWNHAIDVLEKLMHERETREGRIEAARLSMAIHRDRLNNAGGALSAVKRLLSEAPDDGEAIDLVLLGVLPPDETSRLLARSRDALVSAAVRDPLNARLVDRVARIAAAQNDPPLRQAALGALVALGEAPAEAARELLQLDQRVARLPQIAIDESALPELCDPADSGPLPILMRALASTFADALGPSREALGVSKRERVEARSGLPLRNEVAAWAGALGIGEFELFVGGRDPDAITAVATELPAIVVGSKVSAPLSPFHRQALARELFALKRGATILRHRNSTDVSALIVATVRIAGRDLPSPQYAMLGEFQRQLGKTMPRRLRKVLPDFVEPMVSNRQDIASWVAAAIASLDRMAAVAAGDVSWVLANGPNERGVLPHSLEGRRRAERLLAFVLSPTYLKLRAQLGMGVR